MRWKIFQVLPSDNTDFIRDWGDIEVSSAEFQLYVERHHAVVSSGVELVAENNELMRGSYAMISPDGRFFDSATGSHRYSDRIQKVGVEFAFSQVQFSNEKFIQRSGEYEA